MKQNLPILLRTPSSAGPFRTSARTETLTGVRGRAQRPIPPLSAKDEKRFWSKVHKGKPGECWEWTAGKFSTGYGSFYLGSQSLCAHRIAWTLCHGPIPLGMNVLHHCDNPVCCNPNPRHLFLGTHKDNMADMARKGRAASGQVSGERNGRAKLTDQGALDIRKRYRAGGITLSALGHEYGVSWHSIWQVIHRITWAHVV